MSAQQVKYIALKRFEYGGKTVNKGDEWQPGQGKWDDQIVAAAFDNKVHQQYRLVRAELDEHPNRGLRRKVKNG